MDARDEYAAMKPKTRHRVAELLARRGREFDEWLNEMIHQTRQDNAEVPEFCVWMAESLAWARYAVRDATFFAEAARYVETGDPHALSVAEQYPDLHGHNGRLRDALCSFQRLYEARQKQLASPGNDPTQWPKYQNAALEESSRLRRSAKLGNVGPWLFCAPFKILAISQPESWGGRVLDRLTMPTGAQVERALTILQNDDLGLPERLPNSYATADDWLTAGVADLFAAQQFQIELAQLADCSVLHINSALYQLGEKR